MEKLKIEWRECLNFITVEGKVYKVSLSEALAYGKNHRVVPLRLKSEIEKVRKGG